MLVYRGEHSKKRMITPGTNDSLFRHTRSLSSKLPQQGLLFLMMCLLRDRLTHKVKDRHLFLMLGEGEDRFFVFLFPSSDINISLFLYCGATNLPSHHLSFIKTEGQVCDKSEVLYNFHFLINKII